MNRLYLNSRLDNLAERGDSGLHPGVINPVMGYQAETSFTRWADQNAMLAEFLGDDFGTRLNHRR